jgi:hypothetical protein
MMYLETRLWPSRLRVAKWVLATLLIASISLVLGADPVGLQRAQNAKDVNQKEDQGDQGDENDQGDPTEITKPKHKKKTVPPTPVLPDPTKHPDISDEKKAAAFPSNPIPLIAPTPTQKKAPVGPTHIEDPLRMKLLVVAVDGTEPGYAAIQAFLDQIGIPYDTYLSVNHLQNPTQYPLPQFSSNPNTANYYGIVLTIGNLAYCNSSGVCQSTFSASDWAAMDSFTASFKVRTLSLYTWPEPRYGLVYAGAAASPTSASPVNVKLTSGQSLATSTFSYMVPTATVPVANAYMYMANTMAATGETTVPVLSATYNGVTYTVGAIHTATSGQQYLALTMDNNPFLQHSLVFSYGLFNWVTHGLFIGAKKYYLSPQVDDLFIPDDLFDATVPECVPGGFLIDPTTDLSDFCDTVRISGSSLQTTYNWQAALNAKPQTANFRVSMAFNGIGTDPNNGSQPPNDTLVPKAQSLASSFYWMSHTYNHENLDCYNAVPNSGVCPPATTAQVDTETLSNATVGRRLFGSFFDNTSMVTPEVSGLGNSAFTSRGYTDGLRYVVSDASKPGQTPPSANTGIPNALNPNLLEIPRFATNIFYNTDDARTDVTGSEPDEYNHFYGPNGVSKQANGQPWFTTDQTYNQIIVTESNNLLMNMLRGYAFPSMYHQSNLRIYSTGKSLFIDTMNATINKFTALLNTPIISQSQTAIGKLLQARMAYNASGVEAYWTPAGPGGTNTPQGMIQILRTNPAVIDMTGVICPTSGATCETYGGQTIAHLNLTSNSSIIISSPQ